ncbi:MAG: MBL fold metallo-hydrolase [Candidatus Woesearchaeota archaeon]
MEPRILFLGTGGDSFVVGKQRRSSAGIIIRTHGYQFLIDPGPGVLMKAKEYRCNLRETTCVLASHAHMNHSHDLNAVVSAMTYNGFDRYGVIVGSKSVVQGTENLPAPLTPFFRDCVERVIQVAPGQKVGIEAIEILALPTTHSDETCVGFKFFTPDFVLAYSSDTTYNKEAVKQYANSDILILNCVYPASEKQNEHLNDEDVTKIIKKAQPKMCVMTHFGSKILDNDPLYMAREVQKATGVQVIAAVDGLELHPLSYSARMNQRTLNLYS